MKGSKSLLTLGFAFACVAIIFSLAVRAQAQTVTYLADFTKIVESGSPIGSLVQATDGNFYGYAGMVFRMTPSGELHVVYDWCPPNAKTCPISISGPILGSDGNLYGVTSQGGVGTNSGTFYRLTLAGELTTLRTFCSQFACAPGPNGIILASDGNFYGTSYIGLGAIFRISPTGEFKALHIFCSLPNCADGNYVTTPPIQGIDGSLYGVAAEGGTLGAGVLYKLTLSGTYSVLHNFCDYHSGPCKDGSFPTSLVQDAKGNFFGTTNLGGASGWGTLFELTAKGQFFVLHDFDLFGGGEPGKLILANDGNLYGFGGATVFESSLRGDVTLLHTFDCCKEGYDPNGPVFQGTDGNLYGTTSGGPFYFGHGTIFKLSSGFSPFVKTVPVAGKAGQSVIILGNGLTGTTGVSFNGVEATFTVESDTYIRATVPADATTGIVSVDTPSGTLKSSPQFLVTK
jgi:uncharacterized repeat protein (TIGR03803 family)